MKAGSRDTRPGVVIVAHEIHDHGGMERVLAEVIKRGHSRFSFTVIARALAPEIETLVRWERISAPARPFPLKFVVFFLRAGARLRRCPAELVHTQGAVVPNKADLATVHFCHRGFVATTGALVPPGLHGPRFLNTLVTRVLSVLAEKWCYRRTRLRLAAAVSNGVEREVRRFFDVDTAVTPNGVDSDRFRRNARTRQTLRRESGVSPSQMIALFVGGDWVRKGLPVVVHAIARARSEVDVRLWIVGEGPRKGLQRWIREAGADGLVFSFGPRSDVDRFFSAADMFILPSLYETFSLVSYEAAASTLPVITTPLSGVEDVIENGVSGLVVERTVGEVASAIVRLSKSPALRTSLGEAGRQRVLPFTWEASADRTLDLYEHLIREASA